MRKNYFIFSIAICLVVTLFPMNLTAQVQDSENTNPNDEVTTPNDSLTSETQYEVETIVVEETIENEDSFSDEVNNIIEETTNEIEVIEDQPTQRTARSVTYPSTVASIFPDPNLAKAVATFLGVTVNTQVTKAQLEAKTNDFSAPSSNIADITGLDELVNITSINLQVNNIVDLNTIDWTRFNQLVVVDFTQNKIETLGPNAFKGLNKLERLFIGTNKISDLGQVDWRQLTSLQIFEAFFNNLSDISNVPWNQMPALVDVLIFNNHISDISSIPCNKIKVNARNQTIALGQVPYTSPLLLANPIVSYTGVTAPINSMSNSGTYNAGTKKVTWNVPNGTTNLSFTWLDTEATVGGTTKPLTFSGTATLTVEVKQRLTFNKYDGSLLTESLESVGTPITAPTAPERTGYTFTGWTPAVAATMPANDLTYTATYSERTDTAYKVEYHVEQIDGTFEVKETENLTGTTDATVEAVVKDFDGFTHDAANADSVTTGTIEADGSLVLKVFYTRNTYTVTYKDYDDTVLVEFTGKHEETYTEPTKPTRTAFKFVVWKEVLVTRAVNPRTIHGVIPNHDVVYIATYTPIEVPKPVTDDGGPFTTDECGTITDRWGNVMYAPSTCLVSSAYKVPNTGAK